MSKRRRRPENQSGRVLKRRKRRHSVSPSRGAILEMEYTTQVANLQMQIDVLRAQLCLVRREINKIQQENSSGNGDDEVKRKCSLM